MMDRLGLHHRFFREAWPAKAKLTPTEALVWLAMWDHADANGEAFPAVGTIAKYLGHASQAHVQKCRASLIKKGLLRIVRTGGGKNTSIYQIILPPSEIATLEDSTAIEKTDPPVAESSMGVVAEDKATPPAGNATQRVQERTQEKDTQKGEPPPFDLGLLRDELRAGQLVELIGKWLALPKNKGMPADSLRENIEVLNAFSLNDAIGCVKHSLKGRHPALYDDWSKSNGKRSARRDGCYPENIQVPIFN